MARGRVDLRGNLGARSFVIDRFGLATPGLTIVATRTIASLPRREWDACFSEDPEGWGYYRAVESSAQPAFSWVFFVAQVDRRVLAVAPAFITSYAFDTTVQGRWRTTLQRLPARLRNALTLQMLCLGSPFAERCHLGFAPDLARSRRCEMVGRLLAAVKAFARKHGIGLVAAKDIADADLERGVDSVFAAAGFSRQQSLPNSVLALPPGGEDAYLRSLSHAARRDVRRKLKTADLVRIDRRSGPEALDLVPEIFRLYEGQRERSRFDFGQFETLTPEYFRQMLSARGPRAVVFLYWHQGRLLAFNLCYHSDRLFVDKYVGFKPPLSRALNLYVLSWMTNLRYCLEHGIRFLQAGQTAYAMKLHLGAKLQPNSNFFLHRNLVFNAALRLAGPLLAATRHDDDLARKPGDGP